MLDKTIKVPAELWREVADLLTGYATPQLEERTAMSTFPHLFVRYHSECEWVWGPRRERVDALLQKISELQPPLPAPMTHEVLFEGVISTKLPGWEVTCNADVLLVREESGDRDLIIFSCVVEGNHYGAWSEWLKFLHQRFEPTQVTVLHSGELGSAQRLIWEALQTERLVDHI